MRLLLLLSLLLSTAAFAGNGSGNVSSTTQQGGESSQDGTVTPGGISLPTSDTAQFSLWGTAASCSSGGSYHFYKNGVLYQVTAGHPAQCDSISSEGTTAISTLWQLMSATNNYTNADAAGTLSGPKWQFGAAATYGMYNTATANVLRTVQQRYVFDASSYPGFQCSTGGQGYVIILSCHEQ
jgi:hypothetical protein